MRITADTTTKEAIKLLCDDNPGALRAMCEMVRADQLMGPMALVFLDQNGMYGSQIWIGYAYHCKHNAKQFVELLIAEDAALLKIMRTG